MLLFFFKQKTAYEIPKRDWSSDVCSSDLLFGQGGGEIGHRQPGAPGGTAMTIAHGQRIAGARVEHDGFPVEKRAQPPAERAHEHVPRDEPDPSRRATRRHVGRAQSPGDRKSTRLNSS